MGRIGAERERRNEAGDIALGQIPRLSLQPVTDDGGTLHRRAEFSDSSSGLRRRSRCRARS
jgi:hypothetical protein